MKNAIKIIIFLSIIATISCSKDDDNSTPYFTSYSYSFSSEELNLNYNSNNELVSFESQDPSSSTFIKVNNEITKSSNGNIIKVGNSTLTYNTLNQIIEINDGSGNGVTQLQYDTPGRLIIQNTSYFGGIINETKNLTYDSANRVSKIISHVTNATSSAYFKYEISYNSENNIGVIVTSTSNDGVTYVNLGIENYTYDDKPNPLKTVTNSLGFGNFYISPSLQCDFLETLSIGHIAAYTLAYISNNNVTLVEASYVSGFVNNTSYAYEYDNYGNPTKVTITDDEDGTYSKNFFYTLK